MHIDGGCYCGNIQYEAEVDPQHVTICHCTDCQIFTGTAFRTTVQAPAATFKLTAGQPKIYVKTAESGNRRAQAFCPECGTPIYATSPTDQKQYGIRVGTARQRAELRPSKQVWCRSARDWAMNIESMPQFEKSA